MCTQNSGRFFSTIEADESAGGSLIRVFQKSKNHPNGALIGTFNTNLDGEALHKAARDHRRAAARNHYRKLSAPHAVFD